jgi:ppGpp synthetase/RelA/SpoT-type nucleotidyltranferase
MSLHDSEVARREHEIRSWYESHRFKCSAFETRFANHLERALKTADLVDYQLESRTKRVDSYVRKALAELPSGGFKYADPQAEITDAVGVRVLVP